MIPTWFIGILRSLCIWKAAVSVIKSIFVTAWSLKSSTNQFFCSFLFCKSKFFFCFNFLIYWKSVFTWLRPTKNKNQIELKFLFFFFNFILWAKYYASRLHFIEFSFTVPIESSGRLLLFCIKNWYQILDRDTILTPINQSHLKNINHASRHQFNVVAKMFSIFHSNLIFLSKILFVFFFLI